MKFNNLHNGIILTEIAVKKLLQKLAFKNKKQVNNILLIKADLLGDYIVFRNCIPFFKTNAAYKNTRITLLCNTMVKDLATALDGNVIDEFITIDYKKYTDFKYKKKFYKELSLKSFDAVFVCHYSRTLFTEFAAFAVNAPYKWAMLDDYMWISPKMRKITDKIYSNLVLIPADSTHEFSKNTYFTQKATGQPVNLSLPLINLSNKTFTPIQGVDLNGSYVVISSGAGEPKRRLPYDKLLLVAEMHLKKAQKLYLIGTAGDKDFASVLTNTYPHFADQVTDLAGKTSLLQMLYVVKNAQHVYCNESGVYHISVALEKKVTCFSGGGHFDRWAIYPNTENITLVYNKMPCFNCDWQCIYKINNGESYPCIQSITNENVMQAAVQTPLTKPNTHNITT